MPNQQPVINLEWMDEEVRRYRNELAAAQQQINSQNDEIRQQARQIEELKDRLANLTTQLGRITVLERSLEQYKEEIRLLVEQVQESYQQDRREAARIKLIEQDNVNRSLAELRKGLTPISRLEEELKLRVAEEQRLNEVQLSMRQKMLDLEKSLDLAVRPIPYLEEQRARDAKYIAQLQEQVPPLAKRIDTIENRMPGLEELGNRNRQRIEELVTIRAELQQQQRRFLEEVQLADQHRQRLVNEWAELEESREARMGEFVEQMRLFSEQFQKAKNTLTGLESLGERLLREQHQVAELQRLAEERQKGRMEEWEAQAEKRWQREKLLWEQQWHDHDRRNAESVERIGVVERRSIESEYQVGQLWELYTEDLRLRNESMQTQVIKLSEQVEQRKNKKQPGVRRT